jgi:DNA-binding transcriptional LysR family regulator
MDWNALNIFLAIAEAGSLTAAARKLKISQPTLSRKLEHLETTLDSQLFQRLPRGLTLTEAGESIMAYAKNMETQALNIEKNLTGQNLRLEGTVRLTATDFIGAYWMAEEIQGFRKSYSGIRIELQVNMNVVNLVHREADIAIRLGRPNQPDLIAKKIGTFNNYIAASDDYIKQHGRPQSLEGLKDHYAIGFDVEMMKHPKIHQLFKNFHKENIIYSSNSPLAIFEAINKGLGIGLLPDFIAPHYPDIQYLLPETQPQLEIEIWLVTHAEIQHNARIRALYNYLSNSLTKRLKEISKTSRI